MPRPVGAAGTLPGYDRISERNGQDNVTQVKALRLRAAPGCSEEAASGGRRGRPELHRTLDQRRGGDAVAAWKPGRPSRSLKDVRHTMERIAAGRAAAWMAAFSAGSGRAVTCGRSSAGPAAARTGKRVGVQRGKPGAAKPRETVEGVATGCKTGAKVDRLCSAGRPAVPRTVVRHRVAAP